MGEGLLERCFPVGFWGGVPVEKRRVTSGLGCYFLLSSGCWWFGVWFGDRLVAVPLVFVRWTSLVVLDGLQGGFSG